MSKFPVMAAALVSLLCFESPAQSPAHDRLDRFSDNFLRGLLALSPVDATSAGLHEYRGVVLDNLLDDFSPAGFEKARVFLRDARVEADRLSKLNPGPEDAADLDLIRLQCDSTLLDMDRIQSYRHNPTAYVELIGNALYTPYIQNYAPFNTRFQRVIARLEGIPAFLETARRNLQDSPEIWNQVAREENQGNIDLIEQTLRPNAPAALKPRYEAAAHRAVDALRAFNLFLEHDLSKRNSDWRLGAENYAAKFRLTLATGDTPAGVLADAERKLQSLRVDMRRQALALYPKYFPGKTAPQELNAVVSQVLDRIAREHTTPANYIPDAQRDLAEATDFVRSHHLLALPPRDNLKVVPTPEFMRGIYGVGGFSAAPALEPNLGAFYWVTPFTPGMSADRIESKLREYNRYGLQILTIHEAMPGHYVQFEYANEVQPKSRGVLRAVFSNGPYVEGWAVYATELMIEQGYLKTPEMELTFGKQMLRVVSNTILDVRLQTMGMTDQQAMDLMINQTFQEREEATKKLQRAKLSSCQLPTYFVGWRGWDNLRADYRKKLGAGFQLEAFHERALKEGALPIPVLHHLLLN